MRVRFLKPFHNIPLSLTFIFTVALTLGTVSQAFAQPGVTSFTPTTICQGSSITITGGDFTGATVVKIGSTNANSFTVNDPNTITAFVGDLAASGPIEVTTPAGTGASANTITILPSPKPVLTHVGALDPFTNCNGNATYQITVQNGSTVNGTGNQYKIEWGDNTAAFTQTDWPANSLTSHTYTAQGYFSIVITITPPNGCTKTMTYPFYNGQNPLASFTTSHSTTGLCTPAPVEFQIGNWFNNSAGTTYQINFGDGSPNITLTHPLNPSGTVQLLSHLYTTTSCPATPDFTATLKAYNGCFTTTYTLNQIIIRKKPVADFAIPTASVCINEPVCFNNQTVNGFSGNSCVNTTNITWDFGDGQSSNATNPCHTYATPGTYTVTLSASNVTCGSDVKTKQVIVRAPSPPPVVSATPVVYCRGAQAVPLTATGSGLLWYTTATGGVGSPNAPTPSTATPGTVTYYVSQTVTNSCESPRVPVTVTVNPIPGAPVAVSQIQICQNQTPPTLAATGSGLLWYTVSTGGTGSPTAPTPSTATVGSTTWWVSQTVNGCEGPRAAITVNVNALAGPPTITSPVIYCQNQAAVPLTATGSGLLWYTDPVAGTGSSTAPTPSTTNVGSTTYYVSQVTGCGESPRAAIIVTVNPSPSATISYTPTVLCNVNNGSTPNPPIQVVQTGSGGGTYSVTPAGLPINATTGEINPAGATPGAYTIRYTVTGTGGCANFVATATVTVSGTPNATISYPFMCSSAASGNVTLTGTAGGSFSSTPGLTINASTGAITPATSTPGNYEVTYTITASAPCPGFSTKTQVTITQAPSATISYSPAVLCNVNNGSTPNPDIAVTFSGTTGGTYTITPAAGLTIDANTGTIKPAGATAGTYTIKYNIAAAGGCALYSASTTVTVSGTPRASINYPAICSSDGIINVTRGGSAGGTYTSTTGLTINAATGAITPATSTPGTYTVTYSIAPSAPCPGFDTTTQVIITQAPSATINYTPGILCNNNDAGANPPIAVVHTGTAGGRYTIAPATGLPIDANTGNITPANATPGTYTIQYTVTGTGGCANFQTSTTVTINSTPRATIRYAQIAYCGGITTLQPVIFFGTAGGVYSAGAGLSIDANTGAINPSLSTPGQYTVTYTIAPAQPCPGFTTTTNVQIDASPVITFSNAVQSICSGGTAIYTPSSTVAGTTYAWSVVGALPAGIAGVTAGNASGANPAISLSFTNTGITGRTLTVQVTPTNPSATPCAGAPVILTLTVNPMPPAPIVDTAHFCMGTPATALNAQPIAGTSIKWYDQNQQPLASAPVVNTNTPALFTYYVSQVYPSGCEGPKSKMMAIVHPTPKIVGSSFTHPTACGIPSGTIVLNVLDLNDQPIPNIPVVVHYNKFQTSLTYTGTTNGNGAIVIPLTAGTYSNISVSTYGCASAQIPNVFVLRDPNPPAQPVAGYNPPICSETPLTLTALSPTSTVAGPIDYVWAGPAFGPFADTVRNTTITFPAAPVSYAGTYVVYAIQNNCISLPTSFQVVIKQSPSKPRIVTRTPLCVGDALSLQAFSSMPGPNTSLNFEWKGPGTGFPVNTPNAGISHVKVSDGGIYSITVTSPQTGCSSTTDTLIQVGDYPIVQLPSDTLTLPTGYLLRFTPVITNASTPGVLPIKTFSWTPSQDIACNDAVCAAPVATVKNNVCYVVKATNIYNCSSSDTQCVKVFCRNSQVFIPNAFTPRGNVAENTRLTVRASGIASVKSFRVFNRWGKIVFERNNFAPNNSSYGWDGMANGRLADTGVYVYTVEVVCENGVSYTYKGNVTLL